MTRHDQARTSARAQVRRLHSSSRTHIPSYASYAQAPRSAVLALEALPWPAVQRYPRCSLCRPRSELLQPHESVAIFAQSFEHVQLTHNAGAHEASTPALLALRPRQVRDHNAEHTSLAYLEQIEPDPSNAVAVQLVHCRAPDMVRTVPPRSSMNLPPAVQSHP